MDTAETPAPAGGPAAPAAPLGGRLFKMLAPFIGLIFVYAIFFFFADEKFRSAGNMKTILQQSAIVGVAALGMTMIIIGAGIDLSVGSVVALATVVMALTLKAGPAEPGILFPIVAALAGVLACCFCGLLNGSMIALLGIVPFIVTLGMMQIARGVALGISGQTIVLPKNTWLSTLMVIDPSQGENLFSIAPGVWIMLALTAACWVMLRYTAFGRHIYAVGSNEATARLCGINVRINRMLVYTIGGLFAGLSGVLNFAQLRMGDPTTGMALELDVIAAVVIGGGSFSGGVGSVVGSIIGAVIIAMLRNGCVLAGVDKYITNLMIGTIIIVAVGVDQLKNRRQA